MAMNKEYFWAGQLSKKKPSITWNPTIGDEDDDDSFDESSVQHFLFLKQAVLGKEAKESDGRSIVQVASEDIDGETIKQPLFSLKIGLNECTTLDVGFQPPVTFNLIEGNGPIYLSGQHALELQDDKLDDFEDEDEDGEVEETTDGLLDVFQSNKRKRPVDTPSDINKKKQPKLDQSASSAGKTSDDDEDDDDEEDDEDFDPAKVKNDSKTSEENDDEDDDMEDMEDDDDDEDESEDDDEDDDDEEEEEKPKKLNLKKEQAQKKNTKLNGKTPKQEVKTPGGGDAKAKASQKKKGKPQTVQEIKDDIAKSPGKPKKEAKFFNYVKNTYRVTDQQKLQELWNWHKNTNL